MKILNNSMRFISILLTIMMVVMIAGPSMIVTAVPLVSLGTASNFAVLAGSAISNTGTTTVNGNVGISPLTSITGWETVTGGAQHINDAVAITAQADLLTAYNTAVGVTPATTKPSELGGTTLTAGTYTSGSSFQITGTLTLDALGDSNAVFIFKSPSSTLTTASNSSIILAGNAQSNNIFWIVGSSATIGTNSQFVGNVLAFTSITATTGATVQGRLLALNGAVTLQGNTFLNATTPTPSVAPSATPSATPSASPSATPSASPSVAPSASPSVAPSAAPSVALATLHVIKHVINDNGRTAVAADFTLHVKFSGIDVALSPASGVESPGTTYTLAAGTYVVSEDANSLYSTSYSGDSDSSGNITLASGDNKTVTITNNDKPYSSGGGGHSSSVYPPLINITKIPEPLALPLGQGMVTYTYKVTNPGYVALSNLIVTDDKISTVSYVSGDVNLDKLLQQSETWIYTSEMILTETTRNTATAKGSANGMTATDTAVAIVIVTPLAVVPPTIYPPLINIVKIPEPLALTSGQGTVTYTYKVTNPGNVTLSNVSVTDNKVSPVTYISGDINKDNLLQTNETWIYTSEARLNKTTTNTATAKGIGNGMEAIDYAYATVVVTLPEIITNTPNVQDGIVVTHTINGGQIPKTSTPIYELLMGGILLVLIGALGLSRRKRYE